MVQTTDVLVVGGGCGGAAAAVQAARMGVKVILADEIPWLGGMMTSAGVSCMDGNSGTLRTGMYREVTDIIGGYYGSFASTNTGAWVSVLCYEPKVGNQAWQYLVSSTGNITTYFNSTCQWVLVQDSTVLGAVFQLSNGDMLEVRAHVTIDGTEYGDVMEKAGIPYRLGRDSQSDYGEYAATTTRDDLVQDITFCAIFKNYGTPTTLIPMPPGYDASKYNGSASEFCTNLSNHLHTVYNFANMMSYGKLQNNKYMINWPIHGNDWDVNLMELSYSERTHQLQLAKNETLGFLYYIQTVCGHPEIGLATDEYPTSDYLPFIPYVRESRRMEGEVTYRLQDVIDRYNTVSGPLYKTSIAGGDYSIDHHHKKFHNDLDNPYRLEGEHYPASQSVTIPYGSLIPKSFNGFMATDKNISVSHIVNGATRLQPVVVLGGQGAGAAAALSCISSIQPRDVNIRQVQQVLLDNRSALMPFDDLADNRWSFQALQRITLSGVIKGTDNTSGWLKKLYIYPTQTMTEAEGFNATLLSLDTDTIISSYVDSESSATLTRADAVLLAWEQSGFPQPVSLSAYYSDVDSSYSAFTAVQYAREQGWTIGWADGSSFSPGTGVTREVMATILDKAFDPFNTVPLDSQPSIQTTLVLAPVWKRHLDTSAEGWTANPPGWFTSTGDYARTLAFNPITRHLLIPDSNLNQVHIIDPSNGADIGSLDNSSIGVGVRSLMSLDVDSAGVIYACNYDSGTFRIYRWDGESSLCQIACQTSLPLAGGRVLQVRGTGPGTEILISNANSTGSFYLFSSLDGLSFQWNQTALISGYIAGDYGFFGITPDHSNQVYVKGRTSSLIRVEYNGASWIQDSSFTSASFFSSGCAALDYIPRNNWLIGFAHEAYGPYTSASGGYASSKGLLIYELTGSNGVKLKAIAPMEETYANGNDAGGIAYDPISQRLFILTTNNGYAVFDTSPMETQSATKAPLWSELD